MPSKVRKTSQDALRRADLLTLLEQELRQFAANTAIFNQHIADRLGINLTDFHCINLLDLMGALTAGQLGQLTQLTTGAITGVIDRLERAGFAHRERGSSDRRKVIIQPISEQIKSKIHPFFGVTSQAMAELYTSYTDAELAVIADFIRRTNQISVEATTKLKTHIPQELQKP